MKVQRRIKEDNYASVSPAKARDKVFCHGGNFGTIDLLRNFTHGVTHAKRNQYVTLFL